MKPFYHILLLLAACAAAVAGPAYYTKTLEGEPSSVAATTTNTTAGTEYEFPLGEIPAICSVFVRATGNASTTNGTYTVVLATSYDGTNYDTASQSALTVSIDVVGNTTVQKRALFYLHGVRGIKVVERRNTFQGPITNPQVILGAVVEK